MKMNRLLFVLFLLISLDSASGHVGGHGERAPATDAVRRAPTDVSWPALPLALVCLGVVFLMLKAGMTAPRLLVGGVSFCLFVFACSSDDSPTAPGEGTPGGDAAQEPSDESPGGDQSGVDPADGEGGAGTSGDQLANAPAVMSATFAPYGNVTTRFDDTWFYVESDGIPEHDMMINITAWIAQVPLPHPYVGDNAWQIPLNPTYADNPVSIETDLQRGAIAIAANGIPIFNPLNASGLISKEIGELDDFGGHSGRADDYHYHTAPLHLEATSGNMPIAYGFDGFAVYGSSEPDGTPMQALDEFHGHEWAGSYHITVPTRFRT